MNSSSASRILLSLLLLLAAATPGAFAHTVRSRELCGVLSFIHPSQRALQVTSEQSSKVFNFVLPARAPIFKNWRPVDPAAISNTDRACVYYRSPLFGKPFVTRIVILTDDDSCPPFGRGGLLQSLCR